MDMVGRMRALCRFGGGYLLCFVVKGKGNLEACLRYVVFVCEAEYLGNFRQIY